MQHTESPLILLVEDNENDAELLRYALKKTKVSSEVEWVRTGEEAVQYLTGLPETRPIPGVILCDMRMPLGNGIALIKWVRASPRFTKVPIILVTGSGFKDDWRSALAAGANWLVHKDSVTDNPRRLALAVAEFLGLNKRSATRRGSAEGPDCPSR